MGKEINKLVDAQSSSEIPKHNQSIITRVRQYLGQTNCKNSFHIILFILQRSPAGERSKKKKRLKKLDKQSESGGPEPILITPRAPSSDGEVCTLRTSKTA